MHTNFYKILSMVGLMIDEGQTNEKGSKRERVRERGVCTLLLLCFVCFVASLFPHVLCYV